jgi:hypothetical protein
MNEIELKTKIEGLEKAVKEHKDSSETYMLELEKAQQELKDYNKPELTSSQMGDIEEAIEKAVGQFDFSDTDNYEIDYGIDYDSRITCESHEFINSSDLVQMIVDKVCKLFKEIEENEVNR